MKTINKIETKFNKIWPGSFGIKDEVMYYHVDLPKEIRYGAFDKGFDNASVKAKARLNVIRIGTAFDSVSLDEFSFVKEDGSRLSAKYKEGLLKWAHVVDLPQQFVEAGNGNPNVAPEFKNMVKNTTTIIRKQFPGAPEHYRIGIKTQPDDYEELLKEREEKMRGYKDIVRKYESEMEKKNKKTGWQQYWEKMEAAAMLNDEKKKE